MLQGLHLEAGQRRLAVAGGIRRHTGTDAARIVGADGQLEAGPLGCVVDDAGVEARHEHAIADLPAGDAEAGDVAGTAHAEIVGGEVCVLQERAARVQPEVAPQEHPAPRRPLHLHVALADVQTAVVVGIALRLIALDGEPERQPPRHLQAFGDLVGDGETEHAGRPPAAHAGGHELPIGVPHRADGRITGEVGRVSRRLRVAGPFTVDMTTVTSDQDRRDRQFQGRVMDTTTYPTATFKVSRPIDLPSIPAEGATTTVDVPGELTMHGTTKPVTIKISTRHSGSTVQVSGSVPVVFADWNIPNPSFAGVVTTEDHGVMEFLVSFTHA